MIRSGSPYKAKGRPNLVAFNEDVGLMTLAPVRREQRPAPLSPNPLRSLPVREAPPRRAIYSPMSPPPTRTDGEYTCATRSRIRSLRFRRRRRHRRPRLMQVFSDMARRHGIYIVGSNTQPRFRESQDPARSTCSGTRTRRNRRAFTWRPARRFITRPSWGPKPVTQEGLRLLRNVVASNLKVPLTPIEQGLGVTAGPATGADAIANLKPYRSPGPRPGRLRDQSFPAFRFGYDRQPVSTDAPCADVTVTYMRCLSHLGTNLVIRMKPTPVNGLPRRHLPAAARLDGSTWRSVVDPGVKFTYNVTRTWSATSATCPSTARPRSPSAACSERRM